MKKTKTKRLARRERELASKMVAEEVRTGLYSREQAVAIGLSRARRAAEKKKVDAVVAKYL